MPDSQGDIDDTLATGIVCKYIMVMTEVPSYETEIEALLNKEEVVNGCGTHEAISEAFWMNLSGTICRFLMTLGIIYVL